MEYYKSNCEAFVISVTETSNNQFYSGQIIFPISMVEICTTEIDKPMVLCHVLTVHFRIQIAYLIVFVLHCICVGIY